MTTQAETRTPPTKPTKVRHYGFSVLVTGLARMWRAWLPAVVWIVLNALVQAGLVSTSGTVAWSWTFAAQAVASAVFWLLTLGVLSAGALQSAIGPASFGSVMAQLRANFALFAGWVVVQTIVVGIGYAFWTWPGALVALLTVFIPLAAMDGQGNALAANFRAIASHPFRWLITGIIVAVIGAVGFQLGALNSFFVGGWLGALVANLLAGVFAWWFLTAWACLYLSRRGATAPEARLGAESADRPAAQPPE